MAGYAALYDACVLYPAPLRDFLLQLAGTGLFRARWSDDIQAEWTRNVLASRPDIAPEQLERTCQLMDAAVPDARVRGYAKLIPTLSLPDPDDRHVLAAAIRGRCDVIVTFNLKDFPPAVLAEDDIEVQHPDEFIAHLIDLRPEIVCLAAKSCRARLKKPALSADDYILSLAAQKLPQTARFLHARRAVL
jgi:predicted nucleic acid-binding protein